MAAALPRGREHDVARDPPTADGCLPRGAWLVCRWCLSRLIGRAPQPRRRIVVGRGARVLRRCRRVRHDASAPSRRSHCSSSGCSPAASSTPSSPAWAFSSSPSSCRPRGRPAHPAGFIAVAPLVLCVPRMWRDARTRVSDHPDRPDRGASHRARLDAAPRVPGLGCHAAEREHRAHHGVRERSLERRPSRVSSGTSFLNDWGASPVRREFVALLFLAVAALAVERLSRGGER